VQQQL